MDIQSKIDEEMLAASHLSPSEIIRHCPQLKEFGGQLPSEIRAFWVSASDALNELCPAEVLAGKPIEARSNLHESQKRLMELQIQFRISKIRALASSYIHRSSAVE
jgi:hypothetical protein